MIWRRVRFSTRMRPPGSVRVPEKRSFETLRLTEATSNDGACASPASVRHATATSAIPALLPAHLPTRLPAPVSEDEDGDVVRLRGPARELVHRGEQLLENGVRLGAVHRADG